ncbi:MAG: hypothetical protein HC888_12250 [Candidatus Competibacteraceae bacterium]|nr:hypothetical protein [Candidatus Competibacteraceae bacterium]
MTKPKTTSPVFRAEIRAQGYPSIALLHTTRRKTLNKVKSFIQFRAHRAGTEVVLERITPKTQQRKLIARYVSDELGKLTIIKEM